MTMPENETRIEIDGELLKLNGAEHAVDTIAENLRDMVGTNITKMVENIKDGQGLRITVAVFDFD